jgi:hypothetical protein
MNIIRNQKRVPHTHDSEYPNQRWCSLRSMYYISFLLFLFFVIKSFFFSFLFFFNLFIYLLFFLFIYFLFLFYIIKIIIYIICYFIVLFYFIIFIVLLLGKINYFLNCFLHSCFCSSSSLQWWYEMHRVWFWRWIWRQEFQS